MRRCGRSATSRPTARQSGPWCYAKPFVWCEGQGPGPTSSIAKYAMVTLLRRALTATLGLTGRIAMLEESDPAVFQPYFDAPAELIGGGTPEIQLTVIASMVLGLPRN